MREANPKAYAAVLAAIEEANQFIASNPRRTAEIFQSHRERQDAGRVHRADDQRFQNSRLSQRL